MDSINEYFIKGGIFNINRSIELIKKSINLNNLNLSGLSVFTEAASGDFIYTPIIAAMSGADMVYAITADSKYALKEEVKKNTMLLAKMCGVDNRIEVVFNKSNINKADIITNLGFVRPIDIETINLMKETAVIPYMCESWEVRENDVDISYCKQKGIKVMGTNENYKGLEVFSFSGPLAVKMLFDAGIEVLKSKIVIISNDNFGPIIYNTLLKLSCDVELINKLSEENYEKLRGIDALIIADYTSQDVIIGRDSPGISGEILKSLSDFVTIIQFAGIVDIEDLKQNNICFYPKHFVGRLRMGKTLAYLGPKPIIDLHCAGLKVGEIMAKSKYPILNELCQEI